MQGRDYAHITQRIAEQMDAMKAADSRGQRSSTHAAKPAAPAPPPSFEVNFLNYPNQSVVHSLYTSGGPQCQNCGLRLPQAEMQRHMDWHFKQNQWEKEREMRAGELNQRGWTFLVMEEWFHWPDTTPEPEAVEEEKEDEGPVVPEIVVPDHVEADESQPDCPICNEKLVVMHNEDEERWDNSGAFRLDEDVTRRMGTEAIPFSVYLGKIIHVLCFHSLLVRPTLQREMSSSSVASNTSNGGFSPSPPSSLSSPSASSAPSSSFSTATDNNVDDLEAFGAQGIKLENMYREGKEEM